MIESRQNSSNPSVGVFSVISDSPTGKSQQIITPKLIFKIILILLLTGLVIYLFIDYERFNDLFPHEIYDYILKNYDSIIIYSKIIHFLSDYHIFMILFICGFCKWNIYKSCIHFFGFFICEYIIFLIKIIFKKEPLLLTIYNEDAHLSEEDLDTLCEFTGEYECPSYRAGFVIYSYMSFISLLFKEKKIRNHQKTKIVLFIILAIFALVMNGGLILLLQNTISSIIIGTAIGFIIYFFMFSLLKIDYDRSEQMLSILNINVFFYILINVILFSIIFILYIFLYKEEKEEEEKDYQKICNNYSLKKMNSETFFQSLSFFCNLTMIICIKIQRKLIFGNDGNFVSRNFNMEEIIDQNNLLAKIRNDETYKFNKSLLIKYIYKVLICLAITIIAYLLFAVIKYYRNKHYYIALSILAYTLPINLLVIFLFLFAKILFIKLGLEIYNDSE